MLAGMDEDLALAMTAAAAANSECSSGCQSGWTTYLDDDYSCSRGTARPPHGKAQQSYYCEFSEEEDLSMISDASSGPRQQSSAGNDTEGAAAARANAERRGRREERRSKRAAAAAAASLLEDTASSSACFGNSKTMSSGDANGYAYADAPMMEMSSSAGFSCDFSATTGFKSSPLNGAPLGGYLQMQYSPPAPVNPMPTRQGCRDGSEKKRW